MAAKNYRYAGLHNEARGLLAHARSILVYHRVDADPDWDYRHFDNEQDRVYVLGDSPDLTLAWYGSKAVLE